MKSAVEKIAENEKCSVEKASSIYETTPYGIKDQENFFNAAIKIKTDYDLIELFYFLKSIEMDIGRVVSKKWGPREIDLDILLFNDDVHQDEVVTIPHTDIEKRDFVLVPLCEVEKKLVHPLLKKRICDIDLAKIGNHIINKLEESLIN